MKTLDNRIKYYELIMKYDDTSKVKEFTLPQGFHYEFFKEGNELDWVNIHIESGEFTSIEEGLEYFHTFYDSFIDELNKRCIFIVDDNTNEKVGTATISLLEKEELGCNATVDWVAIKKSYQGKHLGRPLISKFINIAYKLGHKELLLHTQTTTWLAAKLYLDFGFVPVNIEEKEGWNILKTLTNHKKLNNFAIVSKEDVYDLRNIEIEKELKKIFNKKDFNYEVWYKNGLHNVYVYVYCNKETYEYEYYEENNKITLAEVIDKKYKK